MKKIAILGSTGSIGTQTLEVISDNKNIFEVELLSAFSNDNLLIAQAIKYKPKAIIFGDISKEKVLREKLKNENIEIYFGEESLNNFLKYCSPDIVLTALVGKSGLIPTINAVKKGIAAKRKVSIQRRCCEATKRPALLCRHTSTPHIQTYYYCTTSHRTYLLHTPPPKYIFVASGNEANIDVFVLQPPVLFSLILFCAGKLLHQTCQSLADNALTINQSGVPFNPCPILVFEPVPVYFIMENCAVLL